MKYCIIVDPEGVNGTYQVWFKNHWWWPVWRYAYSFVSLEKAQAYVRRLANGLEGKRVYHYGKDFT